MTGDRVTEIIHLADPAHGTSYCGEPVTIIDTPGDTRPVCQACHRGAMKSVRGGWCPCVSNRPQDCSPEKWPFSTRHGLLAELADARAKLTAVEALPDQVRAERQTHGQRGYDSAHDAAHGIEHLHRWAERYVSQGTDEGVIKAASLVMAAADLRAALHQGDQA